MRQAPSGGYINGPGSGTSDSMLARVSNGEHITKAKAVSYYGPGFFAVLNNMQIPKFAVGGLVNIARHAFADFSPAIPSFAGGGHVGGSYGTLNLTIGQGGPTSGGLKASKSTFDDLTSYARSDQRTSAGAKPSWYQGR